MSIDGDPQAARPLSGSDDQHAHEARWRASAEAGSHACRPTAARPAEPHPKPVGAGAGAPVCPGPSPLGRFVGGSPPAVLLRLVLLSIVVGVVFAVFGFDPRDLVGALADLARALVANGAELFETLLRYFLLGAAIVFPVWLVLRLLKIASRR